jgi:hypothetical protein
VSVNRTLVLRFRDIERPLGETIRLHQQAIVQHGMTWWGWLYRSYEEVPVERFQAAKIHLAEGAIEVLLYDTGQGRVYGATCTDLVFQDYLEASPEPRATPAYYNARSAPAWFQFTSIDEVAADRIVGHVCADMPSASEDCSTDLVGGTIHKLSDLRRQEVTLWEIE